LIERMRLPSGKSSECRTSSMPIQKFRSFEDARRALWVSSQQHHLIARIKSLWAFSTRLVPRQIPRGVRKFRSIEAANRERDQWVTQRVQALQTQRAFHRRDVRIDNENAAAI
jgi:hypothetical protein